MTPWVDVELAHLDLGDTRRNDRIRRMVTTMADTPAGQITKAFLTRAESEAAYRALLSEHTDVAAIRAAVREACVSRIAGQSPVLAVQDTTVFNFSKHPATVGLGPIGYGNLAGFLLHSTLAVSADGVPLGLLEQDSWAREFGKRKSPCDQRAIAEKESNRWLNHQRSIQAAVPPDTHVVTVADREADIIDLFALPLLDNCDLLIRANYDRCVDAQEKHLRAAVAAADVAGTYTVQLTRRSDRKPREAHLTIRYRPVTLQVPAKRKSDATLRPVPVTAILVTEPDPPQGASPVHWLLLTTLPVADFAAAREIVRYYTLRWLIERYHFTLKSCCQFEKSQLRTRAGLERLLALHCIVAWRLLWITYAARLVAELPCTVAYTTLEWQLLWRSQQGDKPLPATPPTLKQAVRWTAALGSFSSSKGDPGVKRLTLGFIRLQNMVFGVRLIAPRKM